MSYGIVCLKCHKYYEAHDEKWRCECLDPALSSDNKTELPKAEQEKIIAERRRAR